MEIDFNNYRKQTVIAWDRLCQKLNQTIIGTEEGEMSIETHEIKEEMDALQGYIGTLMALEQEDYRSIDDSAFFEGYKPISRKLKTFNPEELGL